jgi:hypothetical protein
VREQCSPSHLRNPRAAIPAMRGLRPLRATATLGTAARSQPTGGGYFLGQGALYSEVTVAPVANVISDFTGKPPLGHFFGSVP